jgi:putative restriction endonuclease
MKLKFFVGVTDNEWFKFLADKKPDEVNFWRPSADRPVAKLDYGAPFLFKLHKPENAIVGGGFFAGFQPLSVSQAWDAFGISNGASTREEVLARVSKYRKRERRLPIDPLIGCTALVDPFFLDKEDWIEAPKDWSNPIVVGKLYDSSTVLGRDLWERVSLARLGQRLNAHFVREKVLNPFTGPVLGPAYLRNARLGQGAFRVLTLKNYNERCCITGETTLPVLEAAHIQPVSSEGDHQLTNGLLLRADMHILYDRGLIGVDSDYRIRVSRFIQDQYLNGKVYYAHDGEGLRSMPTDPELRPNREKLDWHMQNVFVR